MSEESHLKEKWNAHDADGNGTLDVKELTAFVKDSGVDMTRNEIAATFMALGEFGVLPVHFAQCFEQTRILIRKLLMKSFMRGG